MKKKSVHLRKLILDKDLVHTLNEQEQHGIHGGDTARTVCQGGYYPPQSNPLYICVTVVPNTMCTCIKH